MRLPLTLPHPPAWEQQSISSQRQSWRAAGRLVASMQALTDQSVQVVQRVVDGNDFIEWEHYPDNDVRDQRHASQYFYHAHPGLQRPFSAPPEHGHFHLFADAGKLGMRPANPGYAAAPAHLLAISMDATGVPNGFFIVNRWVTKGPWLSYAHCARALQQFQIQGRQGDKHVNRFLQALITLYQAPILALLQQREQIMQTLSNGRDRRSVFADKSIEVLCYHPIQLMDDIAALEAVMQNNPH
ncbi:hypothetical protein BH11PSE12_BH11PSE12_20130 [soil metagenome]